MNRYVVFASPAVLLAAYIAWPAIAHRRRGLRGEGQSDVQR